MEKSVCANSSIDLIIERYKQTVYGIALTRCGSRYNADDVFQDVFIAYFQKQPRFESLEHEKAWFIATTINISRKFVNNPWQRRVNLTDDQPEQAVQLETKLQSSVYTAVMSLPEKYRIAVYLHYFEDLPVKKISAILNIGESAVKMRLNRAKSMLKEQLKGDCFDE